MSLGVLPAVLAVLALPASASATNELILYVDNETTYPVTLAPAGSSSCWHDGQLGQHEIPADSRDQATGYLTSANISLGDGCFGADRWRQLTIKLPADQDGNLQDIYAAGDAQPLDAVSAFELKYDQAPDRFYFRGIPQAWVPANPLQTGPNPTGATGFFCIGGVLNRTSGDTNRLKFFARDYRQGCDAPRDITTREGAAPAATEPEPTPLQSPSTGSIVAMFANARVGCEMAQAAPRWQNGVNCAPITDPASWDVDNVPSTTRDLTASNPPQTIFSMNQIGSFQSTNSGDTDGSLNYEYRWHQGRTHSTGTTEGTHYEFGFKLQEEIGLEGVFKLGSEQEFHIGHEWGSSTEDTSSNEVEQAVSNTVNTKPRGTTFLRAFQAHADNNFNFEANVAAGKPNVASPFRTPLTRGTGMSPARIHPCIGYLFGPGDPNSISGIGARLIAQGYSPTKPGTPADQKIFLNSLPRYRTIPGDRCPGWEDGYPSALAFRGTGTVKLSASGPNPELPWVKALDGIAFCTYFQPTGTKPPPPDPNSPDPCIRGAPTRSAPRAHSSEVAGSVYDAADTPDDETIEADHGSNLIMADEHPDAETLSAGAGAFDVIEGDVGIQEILGGDGTDVASGAKGDDAIDGGAGDDSLDGGYGDDRIRDDSGDNGIDGGPGDDSLRTSGEASGGAFGGEGEDLLTLEGEGPIALHGGVGNDRFRMLGNADATRAVELPGEGSDTVEGSRSLKVPANVEKAVAATDRGISLRADLGSQRLVGGGGDDRLHAGAHADDLVGRRGDDVVKLGDHGFDHARGGPGGDDFVPTLEVPLAEDATAVEPPDEPTAHLIEDFSPREGDTLVLGSASFGAEIRALERRMIVRNDGKARGGRPQLLWTGRDSLLRYDGDGSGPRSSQVIAILRGFDRLPEGAIAIR